MSDHHDSAGRSPIRAEPSASAIPFAAGPDRAAAAAAPMPEPFAAPRAHPSMPPPPTASLADTPDGGFAFVAAIPTDGGATGSLQPGVLTGPDGKRVEIISDAVTIKDATEQEHILPLFMLGVGVLGTIIFAVAGVIGEGGFAAAAGAGIGAIFMLLVGTSINTGVGWVISKIFGADYGDVPVMILRFAALTAGYGAALGGLSLAMGPLFGLFFSLPVLLILAVWIVGMDMIQAMIFTLALAISNWLLAAALVTTFASMAA